MEISELIHSNSCWTNPNPVGKSNLFNYLAIILICMRQTGRWAGLCQSFGVVVNVYVWFVCAFMLWSLYSGVKTNFTLCQFFLLRHSHSPHSCSNSSRILMMSCLPFCSLFTTSPPTLVMQMQPKGTDRTTMQGLARRKKVWWFTVWSSCFVSWEKSW